MKDFVFVSGADASNHLANNADQFSEAEFALAGRVKGLSLNRYPPFCRGRSFPSTLHRVRVDGSFNLLIQAVLSHALALSRFFFG